MLTCPKCKNECSSLHNEWRGFRFPIAICPNCANNIAQVEIRAEKTVVNG